MSVGTLQKLLMPWLAAAVPSQGYCWVGGPVVEASAATALGRPAELLAAYGFDDSSSFGVLAEVPYVDVVRFRAHALMDLQTPPNRGPRPWPTYSSGFLAGSEPVPVWMLERTRFPVGAELWRMPRDGEQRLLSVYGGSAAGWRGARGYMPPLHLVGPRVVVDGHELPADLLEDGRTLDAVAFGGDAPHGFTRARPQASVRRVTVEECERVFELRLTCTWRDVPCRVLQVAGPTALLLLLNDRPEDVSALGAGVVEPGVYEVAAPVSELTSTVGTTRELGGGGR